MPAAVRQARRKEDGARGLAASPKVTSPHRLGRAKALSAMQRRLIDIILLLLPVFFLSLFIHRAVVCLGVTSRLVVPV